MVTLALKKVPKSHDCRKDKNQLINNNDGESLRRVFQRTNKSHISDGFGEVTAPSSKDLASVDNNSSIRGSGWRKFVELRRLLRKVWYSLGVWRAR